MQCDHLFSFNKTVDFFLCQTSLESNVKSDVFRVDARARTSVLKAELMLVWKISYI